MHTLLRLPFILLEMALRGGAGAVKDLVRLLGGAGYDAQPAAEIIKRVRAADEATKAVVLLYEQGHKGRASVIRAAGGQLATA
jgi:hypothetical protein